MTLLLALLACSPYQRNVDPWTEARAACGVDEKAPASEAGVNKDAPPAATEGLCAEVIADHLGVPKDIDLSDPLVVELLGGMRLLLEAEPTPLSELREGPYLSWTVIDELTWIGETLESDHTGRALYDLVAVEVKRTAFQEPDAGTAMAFHSGLSELRVDPEKAKWMQPPDFAHALVHEGAHAFAPSHVSCPWWGPDDRSCDAEWDGAYAFQVAAAYLLTESCEDPLVCASLAWSMEGQQEFILAE